MEKKSIPRIVGVALLVAAAGVSEVRAEGPAAARAEGPNVRLTLFYTPSTTELRAVALAGKPLFENDGTYYGLMGEARYGRFSLNAFYQGGASKEIEGGANFTAPTFNPLTNEKSNQIDVSLGYALLDNRFAGKVDLTLGYYRLWAGPQISPANWYNGPEIGLKGRRELESKLAIVYKVGFVPDYSVHGYVKGALRAGDDGNIMIYRLGAEYPIDQNILVTAGFQKVRLEGEIARDGSPAIVTLSGFYYGLVFTY